MRRSLHGVCVRRCAGRGLSTSNQARSCPQSIRRQFIMQVHPDFFGGFPKVGWLETRTIDWFWTESTVYSDRPSLLCSVTPSNTSTGVDPFFLEPSALRDAMWPLDSLSPQPLSILIFLFYTGPSDLHPFRCSAETQERVINGENLKVLNSFLEPSHPHSRFFRDVASPRDLVFFVKPREPSSPLPSRVVVPLDSAVISSLGRILHQHGHGHGQVR
jgi:hypothetical protein